MRSPCNPEKTGQLATFTLQQIAKRLGRLIVFAGLFCMQVAYAGDLVWPIDCMVGVDCTLGYPDIKKSGKAFDCSPPGYVGHEGTDIRISQLKMDVGTAVYAAADGVVLWTFDGKYDRCPNKSQSDCDPPGRAASPNLNSGTTVCTELGPYCRDGNGSCFWCFAGANVVVIRHTGARGVFATRYDHLKRDSILVKRGARVRQGQKIAEVGSAGQSSGPHLHFEVWGRTYYDPVDPWAGVCGQNTGPALWRNPTQPWQK